MTDTFKRALSTDPQGFIDVVELAQQLWVGEELSRWMTTAQARWQGRSPVDMIADDKADDVLDVLEQTELYS